MLYTHLVFVHFIDTETQTALTFHLSSLTPLLGSVSETWYLKEWTWSLDYNRSRLFLSQVIFFKKGTKYNS